MDDDGDASELESPWDSIPGWSGGPVFGWINDDPKVVGVISGNEIDSSVDGSATATSAFSPADLRWRISLVGPAPTGRTDLDPEDSLSPGTLPQVIGTFGE